MKNIFKNKYVVILGIFLIALLVIGGTYAYYSWNTSDAQKTNVVFTVTQPNISASINGTGRYTASNLAPTSCTGDNNNIRETVMINYTNDTSYPVTLTANLSLTSFRLHNASYQPTQSELSALRWIISESNDNCTSNSSDIIIGNKFNVLTFNSGQVTPSNTLPLSLGTIQFTIPGNTTSSKTYYLYIWLDNTYTHENIGNVNSDPLQELTFTAQWDGRLEQYSGTSANTEGYPVTISNSQGFGLNDYTIYGNSVQDGIPTPETPIDIVSLGEDGEVNVITGGKNLFDKEQLLHGYIKNDGTVENVNWYYCTPFVNIASANNITLSNTISSTSTLRFVCFYDINKNFISGFVQDMDTEGYTASVPTNAVYVRFNVTPSNIDVAQCEFGTASTDYESYISPITTTIDLTGHEPLRKIGDVSDYIDYANSRIVRNIGKYIFDGSENWNNRTDNGNFTNCSWFQLTSNSVFLNTKGLSTHFSIINNDINDVEHIRYIVGNKMLGVVINKSRLETDDTSGFKAWLAQQNTNGTPVTVYYQLATPVPEPIVLPKINTFPDTNILTVDGSITPSSFNIEYFNK